MKLLRVLTWIFLALGCLAIAIAQAPTIPGVESDGPLNTQALNVQGR
jgi:hypothetical protein